jgi:SAM-dependent methyltransferase
MSVSFFLRRALFGQPLAVTINTIRSKFRIRGTRIPHTVYVPPIDLKYGIETAGFIGPGKLRSGSKGDIYSVGYGGSQPSVVRTALEKIPNIYSACFLDIGCGKGRALVVASELSFRRIIGVEIGPELVRIARINAARIASAHPERVPIEIIEGDALSFQLPAGFVVAFFYHSGHAPLVRALASRIAAHNLIPGNKVLLVYYNPISGKVFDDHPGFARFYAGRHFHDVQDSRDAAVNVDSVVIWKSSADTTLEPHYGAEAKIRQVSTMFAEVESAS